MSAMLGVLIFYRFSQSQIADCCVCANRGGVGNDRNKGASGT